ncbi:serine carboxypeptidase-like family S10 [Achlya hypogyna]|uniref:Carboxypeptidase n=1 Tax=Achlya hypogyna TaxID=1202772 RepID=A0A1V9Z4R6_ACHHY|nr:serine carboxypeptidase-like family S10 [Achlya hypogyna]
MAESTPLFHRQSPDAVARPRGLLAVGAFVALTILLAVNLAMNKAMAPPTVALAADAVTSLPRFGPVQETQYAGLVPVNAGGGTIFYWFFEARGPATADMPLIVWLNGGPGASSMTGLLTEMGPYRMASDGTLTAHGESWTNVGHMLFFDQPVGTGYTSARDESGYVNSQEEMAAQLYTAMSTFFARHPEYAANRIVIAGESYAGKYVPHIAHYIHERNNAANATDDEPRLNLWGIAIGNGEMKPLLQTRSVADYALALGFIDHEQFRRHEASLARCADLHASGAIVEAFGVCQDTEDEIYRQAGNPFVYDIRQEGNAFDALTATLSTYFNMPETRAALHVPAGTLWTSIDGSSFGNNPKAPPIARHLLADEMRDVANAVLETLLDAYDVLFYAGNMDGSSCNHLGVARVIDQLAWSGADAYHKATRAPWKVRGRVAGLVKATGRMSYVVLTNSGHLVPTDQPENALDMIARFVSRTPFVEAEAAP